MEFESAQPSIVKSIKQRDLLNTRLRLYARTSSAYGNTGKARHLDEYPGARLAPIAVPVYFTRTPGLPAGDVLKFG